MAKSPILQPPLIYIYAPKFSMHTIYIYTHTPYHVHFPFHALTVNIFCMHSIYHPLHVVACPSNHVKEIQYTFCRRLGLVTPFPPPPPIRHSNLSIRQANKEQSKVTLNVYSFAAER